MFQEKEKWFFQNESSISSSFKNETTLQSSSLLTMQEDNQLIYQSNSKNSNHQFPLRNLSESNQDRKIQLAIKKISPYYDEQIETVFVNATDCPASLCNDMRKSSCIDNSRSLNSSNFKLIYNGNVLSPALSFAFQGVKNGSELTMIIQNDDFAFKSSISTSKIFNCNQFIKNSFLVKNRRENAITNLRNRFDKNWGKMFRDSDFVFEQIRDSIDPTTSGESARISDIKRLRAEENNIIFQKVCRRFQRIEENSTNFNGMNPNICNPTIIPEKKSEPSTCPLPDLESSKQQPLKTHNFMMLSDASTSSCRDRVFPDGLYEKY